MGKLTDEDVAQRVGVALLYHTIEERKPQIQDLLRRHGKEPAADSEDLLYQVIQASNERGPFFDPDVAKEIRAAGYYGGDEIAAYAMKLNCSVEDAGNFGVADLAAGAAKMGIKNLKKVTDAIKKLKSKPKTDADGNKIKLKDRLKGIFKSDETQVTKEELAKNPEVKKIVVDTSDKDDEDEDDEDDDKDKDDKKKLEKKILGMSIPMFTGLMFILVLIVIVLIVLIKRHKDAKNKNKKSD